MYMYVAFFYKLSYSTFFWMILMPFVLYREILEGRSVFRVVTVSVTEKKMFLWSRAYFWMVTEIQLFESGAHYLSRPSSARFSFCGAE
jgi:hypothetical protein